jgi:hypothetical protein
MGTEAVLSYEWQPHLAILDVDLHGARILALLGVNP